MEYFLIIVLSLGSVVLLEWMDAKFEEDWGAPEPKRGETANPASRIAEYRCRRCGRMEYVGSRDLWRIEDWESEQLCFRCS